MTYQDQITEVKLGDFVEKRRWFRKPLKGRVAYIPGASPRHRQMEHDEIKLWGVSMENGTMYSWLYDPSGTAPKSISFVRRGDSDANLKSTERLR